jgi:Protein of unknown function DUF262
VARNFDRDLALTRTDLPWTVAIILKVGFQNSLGRVEHTVEVMHTHGRGNSKTMAGSTFQTNPFDLFKLLDDCHRGVLQLPDFQRSWVWDEDRITSLIASVSRAFPVGALMSLDTGGPVNFKPRPLKERHLTQSRSLHSRSCSMASSG